MFLGIIKASSVIRQSSTVVRNSFEMRISATINSPIGCIVEVYYGDSLLVSGFPIDVDNGFRDPF